MEQTFFTMKPQLRGQMKYAILCLLPSIVFALLKQPLIAALVFFSLGAYCALSKKHTVVVFSESITNKDYRGRFLCKIPLELICYAKRNFLDEIILLDDEGKQLLCVESNMTNRERFEQWLTAHNIESK